MKIIIAFASAGGGHAKAAEALYQFIEKKRNELEVRSVDILEKTPSFFRSLYRSGYSLLVRYAPYLWSLAFCLTEAPSLRPFTHRVTAFINRLVGQGFARFLIRENPDCIICVHFFPAEIAAYLKNKGKVKSRTVTVITDFGVHPFWISPGTDFYIVACDVTKRALICAGVAQDKIKVLGIPVDTKFLQDYDKAIICQKLGLAQDKFTVLITTGSFGLGPIEKIVELLYKEVQVLVICAHNRTLYRRLSLKCYPQVKVFGFVDNIQELMAVSDVLITKPGGMSIAESMCMNLVPIFVAPIPGQETENIKVLASYGLGIYPKSIRAIKEAVLGFKEHPERLETVKSIIEKLRKPYATPEICDAVCKSSAGPAG